MKKKILTYWKSIDKDACKDAALAAVLILALAIFYTRQMIFVQLAIVMLLLAMVYPLIFKPFAFVWYGISKLLGLIVPKIVLTLIFSLFVLPVGFLRQLLGKDDMKLKSWKQSNSSVFVTRDQNYKAEDLKHPF